jgi:hypothetical protein
VFYVNTALLYGKPYLKIHDVKTGEYPYIGVVISVSDEAPLEKLNESNFSLYENGWKVGFFRIKKTGPENNPKKIILLIDASKSLSQAAFKAQVDASQMLVNGINSYDEVSVISFNDSVQTHCGFTSSREQIRQCLGEIKQSGKKTVLYDALYKALTLNATAKTERTFIVLFTDGKEEKSVISVKEINNQIAKVSIPVFVVCAGKKDKLADLAKISRLTGGDILNAPGAESIVKVYQLLGSLIDGAYQFQYISQALSGVGANNANTDANIGANTNEKKSIPVRLEVRMEHGEIHDQDVVEFNLPAPTFLTSLKNAFSDERFKIFLGSSFLLVLIVIFISHLGSPVLKSGLKQNKLNEASVPLFETTWKNMSATGQFQKRPEKKDEKSENNTPIELPEKYFAYIVEKEGPHTGRTSKIKWSIATIGHGNENTIVINDPTVSYSHAKIAMSEGVFYLYDMISEAGVYLNGKKLLRPKPLNDFDEILIGRTKLLFRMAAR